MDEPEPLYVPDELGSAYHLQYTWTGWPSRGTFPARPEASFFDEIAEAWEGDGIRLRDGDWTPRQLQIVTSVTPGVSPVMFASRIKGRLEYFLRRRGTPVDFARNFAVRTLGNNRRSDVESYIGEQVSRAGYADPKFKRFLEEFTVVDETVDLSEPTRTNSGRYWYNLHLVLTVRDRYRMTQREALRTLRDWCGKVAGAKGYRISALSVMPDHLHVALRGDIQKAPRVIAASFMNNLAYGVGHMPLWQPSFYAGSFGEYDSGAIDNDGALLPG